VLLMEEGRALQTSDVDMVAGADLFGRPSIELMRGYNMALKVVVQTCSTRTCVSDAPRCLQAPSIAFQISGAVPP
jgi:hypothetical protein